MKQVLIGIILISVGLFNSCGTDNNHEEIEFQEETNELDLSRFGQNSFVWYLNERRQDNGTLVTDIAAEMKIAADNIDTVYFFTAIGTWEELVHPESQYKNFPENTEITVYSEEEQAFFSLRQKEDATYEVLHGGFENGFAYAIVWQGDIWIERSAATYEIHLPEVVEVYSDYGNDI